MPAEQNQGQKGLHKGLQTRVRDFMSETVVTISGEDPIAKAADKMLRSKIHGLVIMDGSRPAGIISSFDLLKNVFLDTYQGAVKVETLIRGQKLITIEPQVFLKEAAKLMIDNNIRTLPVVEQGKLKGIISMMDIMKQSLS